MLFVFRDEHLALDNQLVCSLLGRLLAPSFSVPQLLGVVCVGWRPCGIFSVQLGMLIGVFFVQLIFWWSC